MLSFQLTHFTLSNRILTWSATWRNAGSGKVTGLNLAIAYLIMLNLPTFSGSMRHEIFIQPEFPKMTQPLPKISEDIQSVRKMFQAYPSQSQDAVIYSFYTEFLFLALVRVYIVLESVSVIYGCNMRNWFLSVSWHEVEASNLQA